MRIDFRSPLAFGDEDTANAYARRAEAARAAQPFRWHVAPLLHVLTPAGVRLTEGQQVTLELMRDGDQPAELLIRALVEKGSILENLGNAEARS